MTTVEEAVEVIEALGLLKRGRATDPERIIGHVSRVISCALPRDLEALYRANIAAVADFPAVLPVWNDHVGWRTPDSDLTCLLHQQAVPIFGDGCGSLYGLDLTAGLGTPAVYFFDHDDAFSRPQYAAGSSLGTFLILLANGDRAHKEGWPAKWELRFDPDIEKCPRAPAIWDAD